MDSYGLGQAVWGFCEDSNEPSSSSPQTMGILYNWETISFSTILLHEVS
jgi:hypothetical protein